jgi:hypothetical protein
VLVHAAELTDWTHVAVVYRDGQPSLYLNGVLVHQGLRSTRTVHPGSPSAGGGEPFRGVLGPFRQFPRALDAAEIADLAQAMPRPEAGRLTSAAIELTRSCEGLIDALIWQPGEYQWTTADGRSGTFRVPEDRADATGTGDSSSEATQEVVEPVSFVVDGTWTVEFASQPAGPGSVVLESPVDWAQHPDPAVKYYSGTATYRKEVELPELLDTQRLYLDLGEVRDLAAVRWNGRDLGVLWIAPWQIEITYAARPGKNVVEIDVVNVWNNRLVGDAGRDPGERQTFLTAPTVKEDSPLLPAGLLGPVTLKTATVIRTE